VFGPYRTPPQSPCIENEGAPQEEIVLGWALVVLGGVRTAVAIATGEPWGVEATVAALMILAGIHLLVRR
jgi:hypothetical protein